MREVFHNQDKDPVVNIRVSILNFKQMLRDSIHEKNSWCEDASNSNSAYIHKNEIRHQHLVIRELELLIELLDRIYIDCSLSQDEYDYLQAAFDKTNDFVNLFGQHLTIVDSKENVCCPLDTNRRHTL